MRQENFYLLTSIPVSSLPPRTILQFDTGFTWDEILRREYKLQVVYPDYTYQTNFMLYMKCITYESSN